MEVLSLRPLALDDAGAASSPEEEIDPVDDFDAAGGGEASDALEAERLLSLMAVMMEQWETEAEQRGVAGVALEEQERYRHGK